MSRASRILVAVDGSEYADAAFGRAAELAKALGSKLFVISVVYLPPPVDVETRNVQALERELEARASRTLSDCAEAAKTKYGIDAETILGNGSPSRAIISAANERGADLIIVGSRGLGGVSELFLGSVSHDVVRKARLPVLVVR